MPRPNHNTATKVDRRHRVLSAEQWSDTGKWVHVRSSNVFAIRYSKYTKTLFVEFGQKGQGHVTYYYRPVEENVAKGMFNSMSMGKYVWLLRKSGYKGIRIGFVPET